MRYFAVYGLIVAAAALAGCGPGEKVTFPDNPAPPPSAEVFDSLEAPRGAGKEFDASSLNQND